MKPYLVKTPSILKPLSKHLVWSFPTSERIVYLTFDDGPIPEVTPWVLETLAAYDALATFFCIGNNVHNHPHLLQDIIDKGHQVGNHTFDHINGWKCSEADYLENVAKCSEVVQSNLFRPPYGKASRSQIAQLKDTYSIIMWDVLSADFDSNVSNEQCLKNVVNNVENGSIIVFHDSLKAEKKLRYALPKVLAHFQNLGYRFLPLPEKKN